MSLFVYEVLEKAAKAKTDEEKINILKEYNSLALRNILKGAMDDTIEFLLPEGAPPYNFDDAPHGYTQSTIQQKCKHFAYFVKGGSEMTSQIKRERMFIEILESVHQEEAKLVILMKDKALINPDGTPYYDGITKELVKQAFPGLIKL